MRPEGEARYPGLLACVCLLVADKVLKDLSFYPFMVISEGEEDLAWCLICLVVGLFLAWSWQVARGNAPFIRFFALERIPSSAVLTLFALWLGLQMFEKLAVWGIWTSASFIGIEYEMFEDDRVRPPTGWADVFGSCIVAPVTEELLFRGLLLRGLVRQFKSEIAILLSAGIFGVWHGNLPQIAGASVGGIVLGWLFLRTRSLWAPIIFHACHNATWVFLSSPLMHRSGKNLPTTMAIVLLLTVLAVSVLLLRFAWPRFNAHFPHAWDAFDAPPNPAPDPLREFRARRRRRRSPPRDEQGSG